MVRHVSIADINTVRLSGAFDEGWYLDAYPDVRQLGMDPIEHYLWVGWRLGRRVSPQQILNATNPADASALERFAASARLDLRVAVLAWDVGHNPLGRAHLLAEVLSRSFDVVLVGPLFGKWGDRIWPPVDVNTVPIVSFPGRSFPKFAEDLDLLAKRLDCDAIVVSKPRLPSLQLGLMTKAALNRPLILDIDDHEAAFTDVAEPLAFEDLDGRPDLAAPFGDGWTRFAESLVPLADEVLVSNEELRAKFGGTIVPHVRDERLFDPARYDRDECRASLGFRPDEKVVLFAGTARAHKGLGPLATALATLNDRSHRLCIVGDVRDRGLKKTIEGALGERAVFFPNCRLNELPPFLAAADLVCLLQDESPISRAQLPAKAIDALAMSVPILAYETPPIRSLIRNGVIEKTTPDALLQDLKRMLVDSAHYRERQAANRPLFETRYSYKAVADQLRDIVLAAASAPSPLGERDLPFVALQERLPAAAAPVSAGISDIVVNDEGRYDIVMFWKQNDSGLYGRRSDMVAKYLARRPDVRQVILIDHPIPRRRLRQKKIGGDVTEHADVYRQTIARSLGLLDAGNLASRVFVWDEGRRPKELAWRHPARDEFIPWLRKVLNERGVQPDRAVFWVYPTNDFAADAIREFKPRMVVSDIVDDQRKRPGLSNDRREAFNASYAELLGLSDIAFANCMPVVKSMSQFAPSISLLPNACEMGVADVTPPARRVIDHTLASAPKPWIGYVGNLELKIDMDLLKFVARSHPEWSIILVGSCHSRSEVLELRAEPNVFFTGVVPYADARGLIAQFDVAMVPHIKSSLTETMNPLKAFVYLSQHVPVVATEVPNMAEVSEFVDFASNNEAFVAAIERQLRNRTTIDWEKVDDHLRGHSWPTRIDKAMELIEEFFGRTDRRNHSA